MHRKRCRAPGLDGDGHAIAEMPHVQLARRGALLPAVCRAIDDHRARTANAFSAIGIKRDRFNAFRNEPFIHHVEHFQKRHIRANVEGMVFLKSAAVFRVVLTPNFEVEVHYL